MNVVRVHRGDREWTDMMEYWGTMERRTWKEMLSRPQSFENVISRRIYSPNRSNLESKINDEHKVIKSEH